MMPPLFAATATAKLCFLCYVVVVVVVVTTTSTPRGLMFEGVDASSSSRTLSPATTATPAFVATRIGGRCCSTPPITNADPPRSQQHDRHRRLSLLLMAAKKKPEQSLISQQRRNQLGIGEDEDEYDLGVALEANTDPFITKVIAGSFIVIMVALLVAGVIVPSLTDYGEGVCNPILTQGRC